MIKEPPTLKTIAEYVGVTANTVSLALRDSPRVAISTKKRILSAAEELGYVQNAIAGSLRSGRTNTAALVMGDIANPLFAMKIKAMEREFRALGYQIMIFNTQEDSSEELNAVHTAISRKVDGIVLCPCEKDDATLALIRQCAMPCVLSGRYTQPQLEDAVCWDDYKGGYITAKHLVERGCKRIAWLGVTPRISSARDRKLGYLAAIKEAGVSPDDDIIIETSLMGGDIKKELKGFLTHGVDGICAFSDLIAWEVVCCLKELGVSVPKDVKVTGFDNAQNTLRIPYKLTSVTADITAEAAEVVRLLTLRMSQRERPVSLCRIDTSLVEGESSV